MCEILSFENMQDKSLTAEICTKILQNRFNNPKIEYIKHEIAPISEDAEGFMGEHMKLNITYKLNEETLIAEYFLKRKPSNKIQEEIAEITGVYKHEIFIYDYLLKEYEKYGYDTSFAAKSYYCIPNQALILENLQTQGFNLAERNIAFSTEQIQSLLRNLAKFHAGGYAYEQTKAKELNREFTLGKEFHEILDEVFYVQYIDPEAYCMKFWKSCMTTIAAVIDLLPNDESYRQKFKSMFQSFEFGKVFVQETNIKKTIGHGDLWSNNMMFRNNNGIVECKLLDFQICRYFYPSFDVILAVYCNTDKKYRDKHLNELYEFYYKSLAEILHKYGYNVDAFMTKEEFYKSLDIVKADAMLQVADTKFIIGIPKETLTEKSKKDDGMDEVFFNNENSSVEAFQNNPSFRESIIEVLTELHDIILAKQC